MAYVITSLCELAGVCEDVCPTESIHFVEGEPQYYINPDTCIDCGACMAECPNEAIYADMDLPDEYADAEAANADFFTSGPGKDLV